MKAASVHGGGAAFDRTSCNVGLRGQYGLPDGIDRLRGLDGRKSPEDMKPSSSASQSDRTDEQREVSLDEVFRCNEGGFRLFDLRIALRRYFMSTPVSQPSLSSASNGILCHLKGTRSVPAHNVRSINPEVYNQRVLSYRRHWSNIGYLYKEVVEEMFLRLLLVLSV
jgi:hypothetical protein